MFDPLACILTERGWVSPLTEIKKAANIAANYNVDIYAPNSAEGNGSKPAVLLRDLNAFKALPVDGNSRADFCLAGFPSQKEDGAEVWYRVQKIYGGVIFWFDLLFQSPDFYVLYPELHAYITDWDNTHSPCHGA